MNNHGAGIYANIKGGILMESMEHQTNSSTVRIRHGIDQTSTNLGITNGWARRAEGPGSHIGIFHGPLDRIFWVREDICMYLPSGKLT